MSTPHRRRATRPALLATCLAALLIPALASGLPFGCESDGRPVSTKSSSTKTTSTKSRANWESNPGAVRGDDTRE